MTRKKFIDFKRILLIIIILLMSFLMAFTNNQTLNTETQQIETIINLQNKKIDTINKIIKDTRPDINQNDSYQLAQAIYNSSKKYNIDSVLLLSIAYVQSLFRKKIINRNCVGFFQVNVRIHKVSPNFINDTYQQADKAASIFADCMKAEYGNINRALSRYNGCRGAQTVYANKVLKKYNHFNNLYIQYLGE